MGVERGGWDERPFIGEGSWVLAHRPGLRPHTFGKVVRVGEYNEDYTVWTGRVKFDGTEMSLTKGTVKIRPGIDVIKALDTLEAMAAESADMGPFHDIPDGWRVCLNNDCMRWTAPGTAVYCSNECAYRDA